MPARPDPSRWLAAAVALAIAAAGWAAHEYLGERSGTESAERAEVVAVALESRLEAGLGLILADLDAAAGTSASSDRRRASLRGQKAVRWLAQLDAQGQPVPDSRGVADLPEADALGPALVAARDAGTARLTLGPGPGQALGAAPVYRGQPRGTAERRLAIEGFLVAAIDVDAMTGPIMADVPGATAGLGDAGRAGTHGIARTVEAGGASLTLIVTGPPADPGAPVLPAAGVLLGLAAGGVISRAGAGRRAAEQSASFRAQELTLVADLGALLQQSLDLEVILPGAVLRLVEQFNLDGCGILRADRKGNLVPAFSLGTRPDTPLSSLADLPASAGGGDGDAQTVFPLQRAGRVIGALWARPRRPLDAATARSLQAAADLVAAALVNADAFDQERETVRRLEELDRIKNRFIGTVSHEMRTSASAISGFANLLGSRWDLLDDGERRDLVTRISRNCGSLVSVVEDFLDFSRLERRSPGTEPLPASLTELVALVVEDMAPLTAGHQVVTELEPGVGALADRSSVERILANLLSNAVKYSPAGSTVTVRVEALGDTALLTVEDEGEGIPMPERERVFEAFYRAPHSAVAGTHGAGIGLAVVKEVAERLQGRVSVEDSSSGGARMVVALRGATLPLATSPLDRSPLPHSVLSPGVAHGA